MTELLDIRALRWTIKNLTWVKLLIFGQLQLYSLISGWELNPLLMLCRSILATSLFMTNALIFSGIMLERSLKKWSLTIALQSLKTSSRSCFSMIQRNACQWRALSDILGWEGKPPHQTKSTTTCAVASKLSEKSTSVWEVTSPSARTKLTCLRCLS